MQKKKEWKYSITFAMWEFKYRNIRIYILENNNIDQYISIQRTDKKTAFHLASSNSILCTKLLLRKKTLILNSDSYGINWMDVSIYSRRFNCYQQIYRKKSPKNQEMFNQLLNRLK